MSGPQDFHFHRGKVAFFAGTVTLGFVVIGGATLKALLAGDLTGLWAVPLLGLVGVLGLMAVRYLTIAFKAPVALRLDADGLSGHGIARLGWQEIETVSALKGRKRHRYLGIKLHTPESYLTGLTLFQRLRAILWQWRYGQDVVVEGHLLAEGTTQAMAEACHRLMPDTTT